MAKETAVESSGADVASSTHPYSFLQQLVKACSCCLGLCDSFKDPKEAPPQEEEINGKQSNLPNGSSQEEENEKNPTGDDPTIENLAASRRNRPVRPPPSTGPPGQHH
ncbi:uncharacterized protein [Typha latifolia]|uniref:uncharacterized protein n=1 Tax=Typha latifolia TaxID=4733 RepID=UPI003C2F5AB4